MVQYLDPEIANEGIKVVPGANGAMEEGEEYQPFVEEPHIPDYKSFKTPKHPLSKYFRPYKHRAYPAIFYRADGATKTVRTAEEAAAIGAKCGSAEEGFRWECSGEWKAKPFAAHTKFDTARLGTGKAIPPPSQTEAMSAAIASAIKSVQSGAGAAIDQVSTIVAAVIAAMKLQSAPEPAPAPVAAEPAKAPVAAAPAAEAVEDPLDIPPSLRRTPTVDLSPDEKKKLLIEAADEKGVKIDKRWSLERITEELDKVAG